MELTDHDGLVVAWIRDDGAAPSVAWDVEATFVQPTSNSHSSRRVAKPERGSFGRAVEASKRQTRRVRKGQVVKDKLREVGVAGWEVDVADLCVSTVEWTVELREICDGGLFPGR